MWVILVAADLWVLRWWVVVVVVVKSMHLCCQGPRIGEVNELKVTLSSMQGYSCKKYENTPE